MKENLEQAKIVLENLKVYNIKKLVVAYNRSTEKYEILLPKREEKRNSDGTNIIYQNLNQEKIKLIKKDKLYIIPKKYSPFLKRLENFLNLEKDEFTKEELISLEEELNIKRKR